MPEILSYLTLCFSVLAAALALLAFLGTRRKTDAGMAPALDTLGGTVRTEADRVRADNAEQSRSTRESLDGAIRGFQDTLLNRLDVAIDNIRQPVADMRQKLDDDIGRMGKEANENRDALRGAIESKLDAFGDRQAAAARELKTELTDSFGRTRQTLSETVGLLGEQQRERLDKVAQELAAMADRQAAAQEGLRQSVEGRLDAIRLENSAKLDEMRQTVDEKLQTTLEKRLGDSFRTVSEQLERVHSGLGEMQVLATGVGDLKRVLSNVKTRGTWGEVQLGTLLEQFLSPDQFVRNAQVKAGSQERVEYAVRFASRDDDTDVLLPIDAKFPQEDYERLVQAIEAADPVGVEAASTALEARVKSFAKSMSEKYINPPATTDFAILFLPTESLLAEVLRRPGLFDQLQRECRVTLAGPTTLASMLNAFQMGFRSLAIQKRSSEVWQILGSVRTEFSMHGKVVDTLKRQLNAATNTIDKLGTRTRAMTRTLRDVEAVPGSAAQAALGLEGPQEDEDDGGEEGDEA
ncbi:MAG TPA: DNA recombination protein RmuC [Rhizomicrobium sp.]|jgi:DNA recombination protein RmuC|nr:DNA recombination protein RmuC [Rhizomicrobium sp.]